MPHPILFLTPSGPVPATGYQTPSITLDQLYPGHSDRMPSGVWLRQEQTVQVHWGADAASPFSTGTETVAVYVLNDSPLTPVQAHALAAVWAQSAEAREYWRFARTGERSTL